MSTGADGRSAAALRLGLREGEPPLLDVSVNTNLRGRAGERGSTGFAGDRIVFGVGAP